MADQPYKKRRLLCPESTSFPEIRPPSPDYATQSGLQTLSSNSSMLDLSTEPGSSTTLRRLPSSFGLSQILNEGPSQRTDQYPRSSAAMISSENLSRTSITVNNEDSYNILKHVAFQSLPRSRDAAFSAAINLDNLSRRSCTKGTRVDIIAQIIAWMNEKDPAKAPPVYWLTGLAGLGKTTIAYTICELLQEARMPFASFFCSLQLDSKNSKLLVTTLCRDLAELYNSYAAKVLPILETNSKVVDAGLRIQIDELLAKPWQASVSERKSLPTPIVVVDALDECDRGTRFLEELLRVIHAGQFAGIKFLVTSRPEPKIVDICKSFPPNAVCKLHEVDSANVRNDIETYLQEALPELKDDPELGLLSQKAGGWFIYATTAVRFISPLQCPPSVAEMRFHLQAMLKPGPLSSQGDSGEGLLVDELYERILSNAFRDARVRATRLQVLHTILCAESRIELSVLAELTNTDLGTVKRVVESLHAVLYISSKDDCIYWYHASFPDFVFSQARAKIVISASVYAAQEFDVFCDAPAHHGTLAQRCFFIMRESLHFNMCNLPSSFAFDYEVSGLDTSINQEFTLTVRYALRHWARHLLWAAPARNDTDGLFRGLKEFLDNKLLFWIEAMNLIGAKYECSSLLKDAESWLTRGKEWPDVVGQLEDAKSFSAFFTGSAASASTPHLYVSALSMWHQDSTIWANWKDRFRFIPTISLTRDAITIPLLNIPATGRITCIALSPDDNQIVTGHMNVSVHVWNFKTGKQLRELAGHTEGVTSVAYSPDGNRIVSGSKDYSVRVWDAKTGTQSMKLRQQAAVAAVAFSADGHRIISGSRDKSTRVWDATTGDQLIELQGCYGVTTVAFSPHGDRIVSSSRSTEFSLLVWVAKTGEQLTQLQGHTNRVTSATFSPDGNQIISGSWDNSVRVWDAKTGEQLRELQGHTGAVNSVVFLYDGDRIVSCSDDESIRVWDAKTGKQLRELHGHTSAVTSVVFSHHGNLIVSGSYDKSVRVWDAETKNQCMTLQGHAQDVNSVTFSADGSQFVSCSPDKSVYVWDTKTGERLMELRGLTSYATSIAFSPDGNRIICGCNDYSLRMWDAKTGEQLREFEGHTSFVKSVAFSPDGKQIISGSWDESVLVWDAKTGVRSMALQGHTWIVSSVTFSPDGNQIVSGSHDKSVLVWDAKTGNQLRVLQGHTGPVISVAFSCDGKQIVSCSGDKSVRLWNAETGEQLRKFQGHIGFVNPVAFSPDGNQIVTGFDDYSLRVWDVKTGNQLSELQGHTDYVRSVAFSPDGNRIISGSADHSVRVWANLDVDASWVMEEGGWILSDTGSRRLVWVPSTIRNVLLRPHNTLIISRNGSATISFKDCKLGHLWSECYTP